MRDKLIICFVFVFGVVFSYQVIIEPNKIFVQNLEGTSINIVGDGINITTNEQFVNLTVLYGEYKINDKTYFVPRKFDIWSFLLILFKASIGLIVFLVLLRYAIYLIKRKETKTIELYYISVFIIFVGLIAMLIVPYVGDTRIIYMIMFPLGFLMLFVWVLWNFYEIIIRWFI